MEGKRKTYGTIDEYIKLFPKHIKKKLSEIRTCIKKAAPAADEKISYQIPTFYLCGNLVHFGGFSKHIGFYPGAGAVIKFKYELSKYKTAKGSIQFPIDKPLPVVLIRKIVKYRIEENKKRNL